MALSQVTASPPNGAGVGSLGTSLAELWNRNLLFWPRFGGASRIWDMIWPDGRMAKAPLCKSGYVGSIPTRASICSAKLRISDAPQSARPLGGVEAIPAAEHKKTPTSLSEVGVDGAEPVPV